MRFIMGETPLSDQITLRKRKTPNLSERLTRFLDPDEGKPVEQHPLTFKEQILITILKAQR